MAVSFEAPPRPMTVAELTSPEQLAFSEVRRAALLDSAAHYGVTDENGIVFGGGALLIHNVDTYVDEKAAVQPFDLDVVACPVGSGRRNLGAKFVGAALRLAGGGNQNSVRLNDDGYLPMELARGKYATRLSKSYFEYGSVGDMFAATVAIDGLATLPLVELASAKMRAKRPYDLIGLLRANIVGTVTGNPAMDDPVLRRTVQNAMWMSGGQYQDKRLRAEVEWPQWYVELAESRFDHPAFADLITVRPR